MADHIDVTVTTARTRIHNATAHPDVQVQNLGVHPVTIENDAAPGVATVLRPSGPPVLIPGRHDIYGQATGGSCPVRIRYPRYNRPGYYSADDFPDDARPGYFDHASGSVAAGMPGLLAIDGGTL